MSRARALFLALALCAAVPSIAGAVPTQQLVARSREAASRNAWNDSARALEELVAAGFTGDGVLYDLGVAYARAGRFGEAIWRFEQTTRRGVLALDAQHNLRVTRLALAHRDAALSSRDRTRTNVPLLPSRSTRSPSRTGAAAMASAAGAWSNRAPSRSTMRDSSSTGYGWIAMCAYAGSGFRFGCGDCFLVLSQARG